MPGCALSLLLARCHAPHLSASQVALLQLSSPHGQTRRPLLTLVTRPLTLTAAHFLCRRFQLVCITHSVLSLGAAGSPAGIMAMAPSPVALPFFQRLFSAQQPPRLSECTAAVTCSGPQFLLRPPNRPTSRWALACPQKPTSRPFLCSSLNSPHGTSLNPERVPSSLSLWAAVLAVPSAWNTLSFRLVLEGRIIIQGSDLPSCSQGGSD